MLKNKYVKGTVSAIFWIGIWWILSLFIGKSVLLPTPLQTVSALFSLAKTGEFWLSCLMTLLRICIGFLLGVSAGTVLGAVTYKSETAEILLKPLQNVIKSTPVASFIIISLFWLGKNQVPSFISFLIVCPIVWSSVNSALLSCDKGLLESADIFGLPLAKRIKYIYIPSIKKEYMASLETSLGMAWKSGVAAEVLALPGSSMGKELYDAKVYLESDTMFAWTLAIIVISFALEIWLKKLVTVLLSSKRRTVK